MIINVARIWVGVKIATLLFICQCLILSCTIGQEKTNQKENDTEIQLEITPEQETAFDALNRLQVQMQGQHLYSTFPGIDHDCFPPDSSFVISRAELLVAMEELLTKYCTDITIEQRNQLAANAVLAQEEYIVEQCYGTSWQMVDGVLKSVQTTSAASGIWILPKVLGQRDVILAW